MKNLYCSACNKLFKNVKSFENHEKSKKHKENVANMTFDDELEISDENENEDDLDEQEVETKEEQVDDGKVNGDDKVEGENVGNSTSDIEDNDDIDLRETLSDDSDKVQVCFKILFKMLLWSFIVALGGCIVVQIRRIHICVLYEIIQNLYST